MSRRECHLEVALTPAQCGQLLSRVNDAKGLEELSLKVCLFQLCVAVISNWLLCYFKPDNLFISLRYLNTVMKELFVMMLL